MPTPGSILRQLSAKEGWKSTSKRWASYGGSTHNRYSSYGGGSEMGSCWKQMNGINNMYGNDFGCGANNNNNGMMAQKRVMVVVDETSRSKHAMMWALTHVTNKGDWLTLLHIISDSDSDSNSTLASSLGSLCKACKPEVEVEALVIQGPKLATVLSQVKKLEASVLVLGQKKPSPIMTCLFGISNSEDFVEQCINNAECLTIGVRKQSKGMGGYLISTRWQKNFWLLA